MILGVIQRIDILLTCIGDIFFFCEDGPNYLLCIQYENMRKRYKYVKKSMHQLLYMSSTGISCDLRRVKVHVQASHKRI